MPPERRLDARGAETRAKLLAAAEQLLLDEGYASVTSRRVGTLAGVAPQLVHYHITSMDDLFVELIRRQGEAGCAAFEELVAAGPSLTELWAFQAGQPLSSLSAELVALSNHRKVVREQIAHYGRRFRQLHTEAVAGALERAGLDPAVFPPAVLTVVMTATIQLLNQEDAVGLSETHDETAAFLAALAEGLGRPGSAEVLNAAARAVLAEGSD